MKGAKIIMAVVVALVSIGTADAETKVTVAGSGGMIALLTELGQAFTADQKNVTVEVNQKSIESTGGIMSASEGKIDIGMSARPLKPEESGLGLHVIEIARVATVVGANGSVRIDGISSDALCRVYEGKIADWKDLGGASAAMLPLTRPDRDATKESVRKGIKCFRDLHEPESVVVIPTATEMVKVLSSRPGTIGFTDAVAVENSNGAIVALKLDGVAPSPENVRSGKYKVVKPFFLVTRGAPKGSAKEFLDFIAGPKGAKIIEANKAVAVK